MPDIYTDAPILDAPQQGSTTLTQPVGAGYVPEVLQTGPLGRGSGGKASLDPYAAEAARAVGDAVSGVMDTKWAKSEGVTNPTMRVPLKNTLRYLDPNLGFDPTDKDIEAKYGENQGVLSRIFNRLLKTGATAAVSFAGTMEATVDFLSGNEAVDSPMVTAGNEWLQNLDTTLLPNYETQYKHDNPILSYFNPLHFGTFLDNVGAVTQNLGYTIGAIAAAAVVDAPLALASSALGEAPLLAEGGALARQGSRIFSSIGKLGRLLSTGGEEYAEYRRLINNGSDVLKALDKSANIIKGFNTARFLASTAASAYGESIAEGNNSVIDLRKQLQSSFTDEYGNYVGDEETTKRIDDTVRAAGKDVVASNFGFLFVSNMFGLGSILRPGAEAIRATERALAKEVSLTLSPTNINMFEAVANPVTRMSKLTARLSNPTAMLGDNIREYFEEMYQTTVQSGVQNYYTHKFSPRGNNDAETLADSLSSSLIETFGTAKGQESGLMGFLGGAIQGGYKAIQNRNRGILSGAELGQSIIKNLNEFTVTGLFNTNRTEAVTASDIQYQLQQAAKNKDIFAYKNLQHQALFNFVESGVKSNKFDARIEQLEALKKLDADNFQTLFNLELNTKNRNSVNQYVDGIIEKAKEMKSDIDKVNTVYGQNPFSRSKDSKSFIAFQEYKTEIANAISQQRDYLKRSKQVKEDIFDTIPSASVDDVIALSDEQGIKDTIIKFNKRIADLKNSEGIAAGNEDLIAGFRKEREFLEENVAMLDSNMKNYNPDLYLQGITPLYNYFGNGSSVEGETDLHPLDVLNVFNNSADLHRLNDNTARVRRYYNMMAGKGGFEAFNEDFARRIDNYADRIRFDETGKMRILTDEELDKEGQSEEDKNDAENAAQIEATKKELGVETLEEGEDKIENADKELIAKLADPEQAEAIRSGETVITDEIKEVAKARLKADLEPVEKISKTPKTDKTKAKEEKVKKEAGIVDATEEDTDINEIMAEPKKKGKPTSADVANAADGKPLTASTSNPADNPVQEDVNATPKEKFWNKYLFSPFKMLNRLLSRNYKDSPQRDNLYNILFSGNIGQVNNLRLEIANSIKGNDDTARKKVVYFENEVKKEFDNLYRSGFGIDVTVFAGDLPVGIMHPPTSLTFKRGNEFLTLDKLRDAGEYSRVTTNPADTFEQFKKDFAAYSAAYDKLTEGFDGTARTVNSEEVKKLFEPVVSFGNFDKTDEAAHSTPINKLQYRGKGDAIFSFPMEYNEEKGVFERSSKPTLLNASELTEEQQAEALAYAGENLRKIHALDVRYVYIMRMPNGQFSNISTIVARPTDESSSNLEGYLSSLKAALVNEEGVPLKALNEGLGEGVYIAHGRKARKTYARFSVSNDNTIALSIYNKPLGVSQRIVFSADEINGAKDFESFLFLVNSKIAAAADRNRYLKNLKVSLTPKSFKKNLSADQEVDLKTLESKLSLSVRPNVFVNSGITMMPTEGKIDNVTITSVPRVEATTKAGAPVIEADSVWVADDNTQYKVASVDRNGNVIAQNLKTKKPAVWSGDNFNERVASGTMRVVSNAPGTEGKTTSKKGKTTAPAAAPVAAAPIIEPIVAPVAQPAAPKINADTPAPVADVVNKNINNILTQLKAKGLLQTDCN